MKNKKLYRKDIIVQEIGQAVTGRKMRKLALSDEILLSIDKPARYIGNEVNAAMKDKDAVDVSIAMCFPDVYEIGMSHLGIQILYDILIFV